MNDTEDLNNIYFAIQELKYLNNQMHSIDYGQNYYDTYKRINIVIERAEETYSKIRKN